MPSAICAMASNNARAGKRTVSAMRQEIVRVELATLIAMVECYSCENNNRSKTEKNTALQNHISPEHHHSWGHGCPSFSPIRVNKSGPHGATPHHVGEGALSFEHPRRPVGSARQDASDLNPGRLSNGNDLVQQDGAGERNVEFDRALSRTQSIDRPGAGRRCLQRCRSCVNRPVQSVGQRQSEPVPGRLHDRHPCGSERHRRDACQRGRT